MTNITTKVKEFLDADFIITSCLVKNIMSLRALSRYLCNQLDLNEKNLNAVMSAVRRYKQDQKTKKVKLQKELLRDMSLKTKDRVVDIYVANNKNSQEKVFNLSKTIDVERGDILRIIKADEGIRIIIDEKNMKKIEKIFSKKDIINIRKNLAEVVIIFTLEGVKAKGIMAIVTSSIAAGDISIVEIMSSAPEMIVLVDHKDLIKTLTTLENLRNLY